MHNERQDVYTRITNKIVADLEQGVRTWMKPWNAGNTAGRIMRPLRSNGIPYSGINILMLWAESVTKGFASPTWMTFRQSSELNAHVRKGEKGSLVVYANSITRNEENEEGETEERSIPFMKGYTVFNVEQIEGLPEIYYAKPEVKTTPVERIAQAEAFFAATKADIRFRGDRAYYSVQDDYIQMPAIEAFRDAESFYATLAHESAHNAASRIMPRCMTKACRTKVYPTRLVGIIKATPGTRAEHRLADTVLVSSPGRRLVPVLSL